MRFSSDTGQPILSDAERDDMYERAEELERIINRKKNLLSELVSIQRWYTDVDLSGLIAAMDDEFDDAFHKKWHGLRDGKVMPVTMPDEIPSFAELRREMEKEAQARRKRVQEATILPSLVGRADSNNHD